MPPEKIEIEHGRFKIWSGNLEALQSGRSSLDFRLRESVVMQTNVMKLLIKLDQTPQKSKRIPITRVYCRRQQPILAPLILTLRPRV